MLLNVSKYLNTIIKWKSQCQYVTEGASVAGLYVASFIFSVAPLKYVKRGE